MFSGAAVLPFFPTLFSPFLKCTHSLFLFLVFRLFLSTLCATTLSFYLSHSLSVRLSPSLSTTPFWLLARDPRNNAHPPAATTAVAADYAANNGRGKGTAAATHSLLYVIRIQSVRGNIRNVSITRNTCHAHRFQHKPLNSRWCHSNECSTGVYHVHKHVQGYVFGVRSSAALPLQKNSNKNIHMATKIGAYVRYYKIGGQLLC